MLHTIISRDCQNQRGITSIRSQSFGKFPSSEYPAVLLRCKPRVQAVTVHSPPPKPTPPHPPKQSAIFLDEFSGLPSIIHSNYDRLIITGDFKLHFDNPADAKSNGFQKCCMLYGFNACQKGLLHTVCGCNALPLICGFHDGNGVRDSPIMVSIRSFSLIFPFKFQIKPLQMYTTNFSFFLLSVGAVTVLGAEMYAVYLTNTYDRSAPVNRAVHSLLRKPTNEV